METRFDETIKEAGVTMFKTIRYTIAVNRALDGAVSRGVIREHKRKTMLEICGSDVNREFGVSALKTGAARSAPAAAAAVFARLAVAAQQHPTGEITYDDWAAATRQAFIDGGAEEIESFLLSAGLIQDMGGQPPEDEEEDWR